MKFIYWCSKYTALRWQKEASDKRDIVKEECVSVIPLMSMEYHDILPNTSLSMMSVYASNLNGKKNTLGKI